MNQEQDLQRELHRSTNMFVFKGEINSILVDGILMSLESILKEKEPHQVLRKKLYSVVLESLQNVLHHADGTHTILLITDHSSTYHIELCSRVEILKVAELKEWLETINVLSEEEIRAAYRKILDKGQFSKKGTAGLGFLDIARRTGHTIDFEFAPQDQDIYSFLIRLTISKKV
jgi:hypothetical protein